MSLDYSQLGTEKAHYYCGIWQTYGCLHHKTAYIKQFKKTCFRSSCKVCYYSWANRQSNRTIQKLSRMGKNNTLKHCVISLNREWSSTTKKATIEKLKKIGVESACIVYAPFDDYIDKVHVFYYGKIMYSSSSIQHLPIDDLFRTMRSVFLSAGIKGGTQPVVYFGKSVYCTIQYESTKKSGTLCPVCDRKLQLIYYNDRIAPIPPDKSFVGELNKKNWKYCYTESIWRQLYYSIKSMFCNRITLLSVRIC